MDPIQSLSATKICTRCGVTKDLSGFKARLISKDGFHKTCKECQKANSLAWARKNRKKILKAARLWRKQNPEKSRARIRKYHQSDKGRAKRIATLYNISLEEVDLIVAEQGGVCAISGKPPGKTRLSCDHCHTSGLIRGFLNWKMNKAIAMFEDNPSLLRAAADYLENPPATRVLGAPRYGMIGKAKTGKRKTIYGSPTGPQEHRDLNR